MRSVSSTIFAPARATTPKNGGPCSREPQSTTSPVSSRKLANADDGTGKPMAKRQLKSPLRESHLTMRVDLVRKAVIAKAAECCGDTISEFVLEHAYQAAVKVLADEAPISLTKKQVAHIFETL